MFQMKTYEDSIFSKKVKTIPNLTLLADYQDEIIVSKHHI
jgi:hypothetical protein